MVFIEKHKKYTIEHESELAEQRLEGQRELRQLEIKMKAEQAQHKRD